MQQLLPFVSNTFTESFKQRRFLVSLKHQAVCVYFKCQKCGAVLAINFEFFDTGKKWTYGCSQSFTDELNVLQVNYDLVHFGQAFDSLPNTTYRLVLSNRKTWPNV
jgi:hypothetical protein